MKLLAKPLTYLWNHKRILAGIIVLGILIFIFRPRPKPVVPTTTLSRGRFIQSLSVNGTVSASRTVNLTFPVSGPIAWVGVKKGDSVTAGQTIATLDQRIVQKNLQSALRDYSIQRNSFDSTQNQYNNPTTPDTAATDAIKRILQTNQYDLEKSVISVELQDLARQQSILSSPIAGIVTRADTEIAGPDAVAGTTTFTITDPTSLEFDMDVDQADVGKVQNDMSVQIVFDAYPNMTVGQTVKSIDFVSHTTSNGGNAYTVTTSLPTEALKYRVGMNGNAEIILSQEDNVLTVPLSAVINNQYVYVKTGKAFSKRKVSLGQQNDTDAQVLSGLSAGDVVALDPQLASVQTK